MNQPPPARYNAGMVENDKKPGCVRITLMVVLVITVVLLALWATGIIRPALQ